MPLLLPRLQDLVSETVLKQSKFRGGENMESKLHLMFAVHCYYRAVVFVNLEFTSVVTGSRFIHFTGKKDELGRRWLNH